MIISCKAYVKGFPDGEVSKIKNNNMLFPNTWSDDSIIDSIKTVGDTPPIGIRARDGATLHRDIVNGVQIEGLKLAQMLLLVIQQEGELQG